VKFGSMLTTDHKRGECLKGVTGNAGKSRHPGSCQDKSNGAVVTRTHVCKGRFQTHTVNFASSDIFKICKTIL